jgi:hypothetical protein
VIAVDTSSWIAYLSGAEGADVPLVERLLADRQACLPPVVLTELLSDPRLPRRVEILFRSLPVLAVTDGYWERAGLLRAKLIERRRRARLADTLVAQSCLDHDVALVTRDADFRHFARVVRLKLLA